MLSSPVACGLDIGSNTFSFVELSLNDGRIDIVSDASLGVRLSEGLVDAGPLNPAAVERGLSALEEIVDRFGVRQKPTRAVGTAALRRTGAPEVFTEAAREILGCPVEIITGEEEARLTARGAVVGIDGQGPWIIVDVGGQSTEVSWRSQAGELEMVSLSLGVVQLSEHFVSNDPPERQELEAMRRRVRDELLRFIPRDLPGEMMCVAGTATTLASLELGLKEWRREAVHGQIMSQRRLGEWREILNSISARDRTLGYGVRPVRADVFPAGLCILEELLSHLQKDAFAISANGLRVGAALSIL